MVDGCLDAMRDYMLTGVANRKEIAPTGDQTEEIIGSARREFQRFLNAPGYRVVFGQDMTSLAFAFAHAIARHRAREGSSILISELEHFGNVDPWVQNFADHGVEAAFLPVDPDTCRLDDDAMAREFSDRNVDLVAVTLAANAIGTVPDVAKIVAQAHEAGALAAVDGVHAVPHQQVDLASSPAGAPEPPTRSATPTAPRSPPPRAAPSSPGTTASATTSAPSAAPPIRPGGRAGDTRSRQALRHQPVPPTRYDHQPNCLTPLKNSMAAVLMTHSILPRRADAARPGPCSRPPLPIPTAWPTCPPSWLKCRRLGRGDGRLYRPRLRGSALRCRRRLPGCDRPGPARRPAAA